MNFNRIAGSFILFLFLGCGADAKHEEASTQQGVNSHNEWSLLVNTPADLPACIPETSGRLAYVTTPPQFMACKVGSWVVVDIKAMVPSSAETTQATSMSGKNGSNSLVKIIDEAAGINCPAGGKKVLTGSDSNHNETLEAYEVDPQSQLTFICNGLQGKEGAEGSPGADGLSVESVWKYSFTGSPGVSQRIGETTSMYAYLTDIELVRFSSGWSFASVAGYHAAETLQRDIYGDHFSHSFFLSPTQNLQIINKKFHLVENALFRFELKTKESPPTFRAAITYNGTALIGLKNFMLVKQ